MELIGCFSGWRHAWRQLFAVLAGLLCLCAVARANVIDVIDIDRDGDRARITIRFTSEIQYLRHVPANEGKLLRIFFRVTTPGVIEADLMQESLRSPRSDLVPRFTLLYPELVNGMLVTFAKPTKYTVQAGGDSQSIVIYIPLSEEQLKSLAKLPPQRSAPATAVPVPPPVVAPGAPAPAPEAGPEAPPLINQEKVEALAAAYMGEARAAVEKADLNMAINRLYRVLGLASNQQTEAAQALLGEVREKNGEVAKARAEYELYLRLFPNGADAAKIRDRLAALPAVGSVRPPVAAIRPARDERPAEWTTNASLSSYYYVGRSAFDSEPYKRDQQSLVSSVNASARLRDAATDTRFVFRDTNYRDNLNPGRDYNRIYAAYGERNDRDVGYFIRAGRQNPAGAGVLERFDGVTGNYNLGADWRLGAVVGQAVEFNSPYHKNFFGGSVEFVPQLARPGASLYVIEQSLDGYLNRRAVGSEMRYFNGPFSSYGMLDYDVLYKGLNIGMAQANYLDAAGNNYFVSYDYRKTPSYSLTNALGMTGYTTVDGLIGQVGLPAARTLVADTTASSTMFAAGGTFPIGERWQLGADYRMSSLSGTNVQLPLNQLCKSLDFSNDANDPICVGGPRGDTPISQLCGPNSFDPANNTCTASQAASGRTNIYSFQIIGSNLLARNATGILSGSWISGPNYAGHNLAVNYLLPFAETWRLEGILRYYGQHSDDGQNTRQVAPSLKLAWQLRNRFYLEGEIGRNDTRNWGLSESRIRREYLYTGIRWDYY